MELPSRTIAMVLGAFLLNCSSGQHLEEMTFGADGAHMPHDRALPSTPHIVIDAVGGIKGRPPHKVHRHTTLIRMSQDTHDKLEEKLAFLRTDEDPAPAADADAAPAADADAGDDSDKKCKACGDDVKCEQTTIKAGEKFTECVSKAPEPGLAFHPIIDLSTPLNKFTVSFYVKDTPSQKWKGFQKPTTCLNEDNYYLRGSEEKIVCADIACESGSGDCVLSYSIVWDEEDVEALAKQVLMIKIIIAACVFVFVILPLIVAFYCYKEKTDRVLHRWAPSMGCCCLRYAGYGKGKGRGKGYSEDYSEGYDEQYDYSNQY